MMPAVFCFIASVGNEHSKIIVIRGVEMDITAYLKVIVCFFGCQTSEITTTKKKVIIFVRKSVSTSVKNVTFTYISGFMWFKRRTARYSAMPVRVWNIIVVNIRINNVLSKNNVRKNVVTRLISVIIRTFGKLYIPEKTYVSTERITSTIISESM
jgi:hypothetical protein